MLIALTGAGISRPSGIPTFEEQGDLRHKLSRTYATQHPKEFNLLMDDLRRMCRKAQPNAAHLALAKFNIPILTMNIDSLHRRAGTLEKNLIELHGNLEDNNVVLYGDPAPKYALSTEWMDRLAKDDILLIVGTSFYTGISRDIKEVAEAHAQVHIINDKAEIEVKNFLIDHQSAIEPIEEFMKREPFWLRDLIPHEFH